MAKKRRYQDDEDEAPRRRRRRDEDDDDRPRRRAAREEEEDDEGSKKTLWLLLAGGGVLVIVAVVVVIIIANSGSSGDGKGPIVKGGKDGKVVNPPAGNPKVNQDNFGKLYVLMDRGRVEAILGPGRPAGAAEFDAAYTSRKDLFDSSKKINLTRGENRMNQIKEQGYSGWVAWVNPGQGIFVAFTRDDKGVERVVATLWAESSNDVFRQERFGVSYIRPQDVPGLLPRTLKNESFVDDPKWKRGPAVKPLISGVWKRQIAGTESYEFLPEGKLAYASSVGRENWKYRIIEDEYVEVEMVRPARKLLYLIRGTDQELHMVQIRDGNLVVIGPFTRP